MKKEMLKRQNLLFELHESEFIRFTIKDSDLIFRVAINCGVEEKLGVKSEFAEKFYIYDVICHKYEMIERSNQYAEDVLSFLEQKLEETLEEVKNNKRELNPRM